MLVEDVMTAPVISVEPSAAISEAIIIMLSRGVSGLPVVTIDGTLVGMVTEGDFLRRSELGTERRRAGWRSFLASPGKLADEYVRAHGRKVKEIMSTEVATIAGSASLEEAVEMMVDRRVKRLPVMEDGRVAGIVSRSDLLRALARALASSDSAPADDESIRAAVVSELAKQPWGRGELIKVKVRNGVVSLSGAIMDERERLATRVAAENISGVTAVVDHLVWIEPMSGMVVLSPDDEAQQRAAAKTA